MNISIIYQSLILSIMLFTLGAICVIIKREALSVLMGIELMLNAANLALISFGRLWSNADGAILVLFVITVAAAEAGVGLAIFIHLYRYKGNVNLDEQDLLKDETTIKEYYD